MKPKIIIISREELKKELQAKKAESARLKERNTSLWYGFRALTEKLRLPPELNRPPMADKAVQVRDHFETCALYILV